MYHNTVLINFVLLIEYVDQESNLIVLHFVLYIMYNNMTCIYFIDVSSQHFSKLTSVSIWNNFPGDWHFFSTTA